jgi:hypothetical protein
VGAQAPAFHNNNNKEKVMPKVGNKKFPYTAKGKADAKAARMVPVKPKPKGAVASRKKVMPAKQKQKKTKNY